LAPFTLWRCFWTLVSELTPGNGLFSILIDTGIYGVTPINEIYNGSII
jgi:hypothetical protein